MEDHKFKEGDWVKEKDGTRGMTVVDYLDSGQVRCKFKDENGDEQEGTFKEDDLKPL